MNATANDLTAGFEILWYRIESVLGRGGFGITYLATDTNLGKYVAIKEYLPNDFASRGKDSTVQPISREREDMYSWGLERFMTEARTLAQFQHPNIVRVLSVFQHNNTGYMVMEYEHGKPLNEIYNEKKRLSQSELETIYYPIIDGLVSVHLQGFIHRDIKPANIYIRDDGSSVLLDFGAARQAVGTATRTLTSMLSIGYAPLEQYNEGSGKQGPWTDIYALSASMYEGIAGSKPMESTRRGMALLHSEPDPFEPLSRQGVEGFDHAFLRAIDQGLMIQVNDRPQNLQEFLDMLHGRILLRDLPPVEQTPDAFDKTVIRPAQSRSRGRPVATSEEVATTLRDDSGLEDSSISTTGDGGRGLTGQGEQSTTPGNVNRMTIAVISAVVVIVIALVAYQLTKPEPVEDVAAAGAVSDEKSADSLAIPAEPEPSATERLLDQANELYEAGIHFSRGREHALDKYLQVLALDGENQWARERVNAIGESLLEQAGQSITINDLAESEQLLQAVAEIDPEFAGLAEAQQRHAQAAAQMSQQRQLASLLDQAHEAESAGRLYSPREGSALGYYQRAREIDPDNIMANLGLKHVADSILLDARSAVEARQHDQANELLVLLEQINPNAAGVAQLREELKSRNRISDLLARADAAYKKQQYTRPSAGSAVSLYREVLGLSPDNGIALDRLDNMADRYAAAVRKAIRADNLNSARYNLDILRKNFPAYQGVNALKADIDKLKAKQDIARLIPSGIDQKQGDDAAVEAIVGNFVTSFRARDLARVKRTTQLSSAQEALYSQLFQQYQSLDLDLEPQSFSINKKQGLASARFKITDLVDKSGRVVATSAGWTRIAITVRKKNGAWIKGEIDNY